MLRDSICLFGHKLMHTVDKTSAKYFWTRSSKHSINKVYVTCAEQLYTNENKGKSLHMSEESRLSVASVVCVVRQQREIGRFNLMFGFGQYLRAIGRSYFIIRLAQAMSFLKQFVLVV